MNTNSVTNVTAPPVGAHVCPCGCDRIVSPEPAFYPSSHPREDLVATMEDRIAEAVARRDEAVEATVARMREAFEDAIAHYRTGRLVSMECRCCGAVFEPDEYREHVADAPSWCNRTRWGSDVTPLDDDDAPDEA